MIKWRLWRRRYTHQDTRYCCWFVGNALIYVCLKKKKWDKWEFFFSDIISNLKCQNTSAWFQIASQNLPGSGCQRTRKGIDASWKYLKSQNTRKEGDFVRITFGRKIFRQEREGASAWEMEPFQKPSHCGWGGGGPEQLQLPHWQWHCALNTSCEAIMMTASAVDTPSCNEMNTDQITSWRRLRKWGRSWGSCLPSSVERRGTEWARLWWNQPSQPTATQSHHCLAWAGKGIDTSTWYEHQGQWMTSLCSEDMF